MHTTISAGGVVPVHMRRLRSPGDLPRRTTDVPAIPGTHSGRRFQWTTQRPHSKAKPGAEARNRSGHGGVVGERRLENLQIIVSGLANGCVYGLIALGFVLIYKAAEQVNFAQGDLMILGAFVAVGLANDTYLGLPFWLACIVAIAVMAAIGWLLERAVLRHVFGQSQLAVVILTIAIGIVIRFVAGAIWGHEPQVLESPIAGVHRTLGAVVLGLDEIAVIVVTLALTGLLFAFCNRTKLGVAMQASSQNQLAATAWG